MIFLVCIILQNVGSRVELTSIPTTNFISHVMEVKKIAIIFRRPVGTYIFQKSKYTLPRLLF